jgi:hypothetical protein
MTSLTAIRLLSRNGSGNGKLMSLRKPSSDDRHWQDSQKSEQLTLSRQDAVAAHALLSEVRDLLDEYGPTWYSEELSDKIASVLRVLEEEL